jgi:uncharacterized protein (TIGR02099 family)
LRFILMAAFTTLIIAAAVVVGLAQLALPWLAHNPQRVERWLSDRLGREVSIGQVEGLWTRAGPRLVLDDLHIAAGSTGETALKLPRAELAVNLYAAFQRNRAWNEFRLIGLDLALVRSSDGNWQLRGIDLGDQTSSDGRSMGALGAVVLVDLKLAIVDEAEKLDLALSVPELRVVNLGRITRVLGRIGSAKSATASLSLIADIDMEGKSGRMYAGGHALDLAQLSAGHAIGGIEIPSGLGDLELWGNWQQGSVDDVRLKLDLHDTVLAAKTVVDAGKSISVAPRSLFERLALTARWKRSGDDWTLDIADASMTQHGIASKPARVTVERSGGETAHYRLAANFIDLEALGSLAMLGESVPAELRHWLYLANPQGTLSAAEVHWNSADDYDVDALLDRFASRSAGAIPGIESLDARLRGDAQSLLFELPQQATRFEYPFVFRKPFELSRIAGEMVAWRDEDVWRVQTAGLGIDGEGYALEARGGMEFRSDGRQPLLDMSAVVTHADVIAAKLFWTMNTMPPSAVDWLDRALIGGRVVGGRVVFRGDLGSWPFHDNAGRFEARADLQGLDLAYLSDWPHGENLDVVARFINTGMQATVSSGTSMNLAITAADATIVSFGESVLDLSVSSRGDGKALLDYLRATPIGKEYAEYLDGLSIGGKGVSAFKLNVPLKDDDKLKLDGSVDLANADLAESNWDLKFTKANGRVRFTRSGVAADELAVLVEGRPAKLGVAIGSSARDPLNTFEATLRGVLPVATVFARAPDIAFAFPRFPGEADWRVGLDIGSENGAAKGRKQLHIDSDMRGISINLPAPLAKAADVALPFSLVLEIPPIGQPFTAKLGDVLSVRGRLPAPNAPLSARIDLGATASTEAAPASGIFIGGRAATLDAGGWVGLSSASGSGDDLLKGVSIAVGDFQVAGRSFNEVHVDLTPDKETTTIKFAGQMLDGELHVPAVDLRRRGITAQMKRVHWPDLPAGSENAPEALADIAPASIPPLHLWVGELRLGSANFGDMRLESYPTGEGMRIDLLETKSPNVDMHASGEWSGGMADNRSHLAIDMTAQSLGRMLDALGFAGIIDGGQTLARIDAAWPGAPTAFALANMTGTLDISVDKGRILDVDPGAGGRLFGLLSLREIPRRLSLDFSDLFKSGMSFNAITGKFTLRDGNAYTDDLHINSPAADIMISGRTGLRSRDYDQQMAVTPRAGVALPVVGAIAGGPVGAAAGFVVQGLIGKQINQVARSRYQVTGSWEKPVIALLGREPAKPTRDGKPEEASPVQPQTPKP